MVARHTSSAAFPYAVAAPDSVRGVVRPLSIAPMMQRTDRHYRYMMRLLTRHTLLYSEMLTTGAILHGDRPHLLDYDPSEHPITLQLGGDDPVALARCAEIGVEWGYDEINLNVGCPSDRVQSGAFGACLMRHPHKVAAAVDAMRAAVDVPITVKHRIGVDELDAYEDMRSFVATVAEAGADRFSVHARKAWLKGLSPKDNRTIPPLRYADVHRLKEEFPELVIEINGGFDDLEAATEQLDHVDAVMIGRHAYEDPYAFAAADRLFFGDDSSRPDRATLVEAMVEYTARWVGAGGRAHHVTRHMLNLFKHQPGARAWKRHISETSYRDDADETVLVGALAQVAPG